LRNLTRNELKNVAGGFATVLPSCRACTDLNCADQAPQND
jgi:hypothetical protein